MKGAMHRAMGVLACLVWLPFGCSRATGAALDVGQYAHTAWNIGDDFPSSHVRAIAQTPDGFLWLGTDLGLLRFDGVEATRWRPPPGVALVDNRIRVLFTDHEGALWIGGQQGLASWNHGQLTRYSELAAWTINGLAEDRQGTLWVGAQSRTAGILCAIRMQSTECHGNTPLGARVGVLQVDHQGNLWVDAASGIWRWRPGSPQHYSLPESVADCLHPLIEAPTGKLLVLTVKGIRQIDDGNVKGYWAPDNEAWQPTAIFSDGDDSVWIGTRDKGLIHLHNGRADKFGSSDGLSGNTVVAILNDREGNLWVVTDQGLDRFRRLLATTNSVQPGVVRAWNSIIAGRDGSIWFSTNRGLFQWRGTRFTLYRNQHRSPLESASPDSAGANLVTEVSITGLPDSPTASLFQDHLGRIWLGTTSGLGYLEHNRFVSIAGVPPGYIDSIVEDRYDNLWIAHRDAGLFKLSSDRVEQQIPWPSISRSSHALRLAADYDGRGLWLGLASGGVAHLVDGQEPTTYGPREGLGEGQVNELRMALDGTLWIATAGGLSRLRSGHIKTLDVNRGLPCNNVDSSIESEGALWLYTACGLVRIAASDVQSWDIPNDQTQPRIPMTVFDYSDGVPTFFALSTYSPHVARTSDGRLWFVTPDGLTGVDPHDLALNYVPPPVLIERVIADRVAFDASLPVHLPAFARRLEIDYTALSLVAPEKIRFRYKLEGREDEWQESGNRRQAIYNDLRPGKYRFRVIASNNSGVWNEQGATIDFSVAPAYWQTTWFRGVCLLALLGLLWAIYQLRLRQLTRAFNRTLEARVGERIRIARDLHDTLLQSFQGVLLRVGTAQTLLPTHLGEAQRTLENAIEQARAAIREGRDAVQGLRSSTVEAEDFSEAIRALGEELVSDPAHANSAALTLGIEGTPRALHSLVRDEVYRIASEALRNAYRHSGARCIEVQLDYGIGRFELRVRDDGKGIDPELLDDKARPGHFGLRGMRERAEEIGGSFSIWSAPNSGTELQLRLAGAIAYSESGRRSWIRKRPFAKQAQQGS